jgi:hypothetical protein
MPHDKKCIVRFTSSIGVHHIHAQALHGNLRLPLRTIQAHHCSTHSKGELQVYPILTSKVTVNVDALMAKQLQQSSDVTYATAIHNSRALDVLPSTHPASFNCSPSHSEPGHRRPSQCSKPANRPVGTQASAALTQHT